MYTMKEVCEQTGLTYEGLKFYCNQGLVPNVRRDKNRRRLFDDRNVAWIRSLTCLKRCGMTIREMREYLDLCLEGEHTIPLRREILARKQVQLHASIAELQDASAYIDWKLGLYRDILSGKTPYVSNFLPAQEEEAAD